MADIGTELIPEKLFLTKHRDLLSEIEHVDVLGNSGPWPPGDLFLEIHTLPAYTNWHYSISGTKATLKVPSSVVDTIPYDIGYQLVWKPAGDTGSGEAVALGCVVVQEGCCP